MNADAWRVWNKDHSVEQRTFKRVTGELPEMECTKQLVELVREIYVPGMRVLDVGCAAGHYYNGLTRVDPQIQYVGIDSTKAYIEFAREYFKGNSNTTFQIADIFQLPKEHNNKFNIVFCCNVILHLPSLQDPLKNLLRVTKNYCFIRTLVSDKTHLSKLLYSDTYDANGEPCDFVFQNTYSYGMIEKTVRSCGVYQIEFIDDKFDADLINDEYKAYSKVQDAVTRVQSNVQLAGSKVFEWKWIKITK